MHSRRSSWPTSSSIHFTATGYRPTDPLRLLDDPLAAAVVRDDAGCARIRRDYRVATTADVTAGIYVQGATEHSHGITSTLLSTTAVRVGEILGSLGPAG
jgi:L-ornithine N5-oxygenase